MFKNPREILGCAVLDLQYLMEVDYLPLEDHMVIADAWAGISELFQKWGESDGEVHNRT